VLVLAVTAAGQLLAGSLLYTRLRAELEADLGRRLIGASRLMGLAVDAGLVAQFGEGYEQIPAYRILRERLAAQARAAGLERAYVVDLELRSLVDSLPAQRPGLVRHALSAHSSEVAQARAGTASATRLYRDEEGRLRLSALAPLRDGEGRVVALVGVDAAPGFFTSLALLRRDMLLLGLIAAGITALSGFWVMRQVDARLRRLRRAISQVARGNLDVRPDAAGGDEIGALGRDLDGLVAALVARRDYYESVLGSLGIALVTTDGDGRVTLANPAARRLLAPGDDDIVGRPLAAVLSGEPALARFAAGALAAGPEAASAELALAGGPAAGGRAVAASAGRLRRGGEAGGLVLSLLEVTELRLMEGRARRNERLAALGGMAGGLLHEIGNPLASLTMYLDLLRPLVPPGEAADLAARALAEACRLHEFLEDFRVFAGLMPLRLEPLEIEAVAAAAAATLRWPAAVERRTIGRLAAEGDRRLLVHALRNLLRNAVEALAGRRAGCVTLRMGRDGADAVVSVEDDGPGFDPAEAERLLDPLVTTKSHGTGLGLSIAQRVAEAHGGALRASGRPGAGATFTLQWPAECSRREGR